MSADAARAQAGLDKRREKGAPPGRPAQGKTLIRDPTEPAPPLNRRPSIEQRQTAAQADWVSNPNPRSPRRRALATPNRPRNRRDSSAFEGEKKGRLATPAKGVAKPLGCSLCKGPQRPQTLNELSPGPGPNAIGGMGQAEAGVNAIRPIPESPPLADRPAGGRPRGEGGLHRTAKQKNGAVAEKTGRN